MADFNQKNTPLRHLYILPGFLCFALQLVLNPRNPLLSGAVMVLCALVLYFYIVLAVANKNWLDIRAVFSASWIGTIGLAAMRLTGYQEQWQSATWLIMGLAYVVFQIGATWGIHCTKKWYPALCTAFSRLHIGRLHLSFCPSRLFPTCVFVTLIGICCFTINILIKGFIPCFSSSPYAYIDFYTKFHVFSVAACSVSGLCYYCLKTQPLKIWKKLVLCLCILYTAFIFPIMVVSRGVFVVSAVSLTVAVFYSGKKRFIALVLCLATILSVYWGCSKLRNYTEAQLSVLFEPIAVDLDLGGRPNKNDPTESTLESSDPTESTNSTDSTDSTDPTDSTDSTDPTGDPSDSVNIPSFQLSPKLAFLYGYLTVSHDNFNEAVQNNTTYSYGIRQISPFNVILRSEWLSEKAAQGETYFVRPYLNTVNLIGDFYYDFGTLGVILCMLLWAFLFGINQHVYEAGRDPFVMLLLGNTMVPIVLCFFSTWLSIFTQWLLWGTVLLFVIACCAKLQPKSK